MAGKNKFTAKEFIKAIPGSGGIISTIAKRVGCDWQTADKYVKRYAKIQEAYQAEKEGIKDLSEGVLIKNIQLTAKAQNETGLPQDASDVKWFLSKMAKDRGYSDKSQVENINIDFSRLTDEELEKLANGKNLT